MDVTSKEINEVNLFAGHKLAEGVPEDLLLAQSLKLYKEIFLDEVGVYCLSQDSENELMWAHYADNHYGIMIGWEVADKITSSEKTSMAPRRVKYLGRGRIKMSDILSCYTNLIEAKKENNNEKNIKGTELLYQIYDAFYLSKNPAWRYEKEIRFLNTSRFGLVPFEAKISSITYGCRFDSSLIPLVEKFLGVDVARFHMILGANGLTRVPQ